MHGKSRHYVLGWAKLQRHARARLIGGHAKFSNICNQAPEFSTIDSNVGQMMCCYRTDKMRLGCENGA